MKDGDRNNKESNLPPLHSPPRSSVPDSVPPVSSSCCSVVAEQVVAGAETAVIVDVDSQLVERRALVLELPVAFGAVASGVVAAVAVGRGERGSIVHSDRVDQVEGMNQVHRKRRSVIETERRDHVQLERREAYRDRQDCPYCKELHRIERRFEQVIP